MTWDDEAATWDDEPAVRSYSDAAFRSLLHTLDERGVALHGARVLDFGCGTGLLTARMAEHGANVVGLDRSPAMIDVLRDKAVPGVSAVCGDLAELAGREPLRSRSFDLITCSSVCAFLPDYPAAVAQMVELLVPGGLFVQWDWEWDPGSDEPMGLTRDAIREALAAAALVDVQVGVGFEEPVEQFVMAPLMGVGVAVGAE
jgi:2-polyprenyl-3-methyl-5-hydroxy-6-metoxy-1,4-benzoquinol methylase